MPWAWMTDAEPPTHAAIRWVLSTFGAFTRDQGESAVHLHLESLRDGVATYASQYPKLMTRHKLHQIALTVDGLPNAAFMTADGPMRTSSNQTRWIWHRNDTVST